jgi:hypothetical protein
VKVQGLHWCGLACSSRALSNRASRSLRSPGPCPALGGASQNHSHPDHRHLRLGSAFRLCLCGRDPVHDQSIQGKMSRKRIIRLVVAAACVPFGVLVYLYVIGVLGCIGRGSLDRTYVSLRFDDGWKTQLRAYERLKERDLTGSIYIISGVMGTEDKCRNQKPLTLICQGSGLVLQSLCRWPGQSGRRYTGTVGDRSKFGGVQSSIPQVPTWGTVRAGASHSNLRKACRTELLSHQFGFYRLSNSHDGSRNLTVCLFRDRLGDEVYEL